MLSDASVPLGGTPGSLAETSQPSGVAPYLGYPSFAAGARRLFDVVLSCVGLIIGFPLIAGIAILIKLDSPGPVFFRHERVGLRRKRFRMWKFRKMPVDLRAQGPAVTRRYDLRLTRMGRILERTKLDELPQLLNVLAGDMSIVGPRPEAPEFVRHYPEMWNKVLSVKPGIFGASQLKHRNESELYPAECSDVEGFYVREILPRKLGTDAEYAEKTGLLRDAWLLLANIWVALFGAITWATVVARRWQILNFLILTALGAGGLALALHVGQIGLGTGLGISFMTVGCLTKALCILLFSVPQSFASSMTARDLVKCMTCAVCSSALLVTALVASDFRDLGRLALALDFFIFVSAMLGYKLTLYKIYLNFVVRHSRELNRRMILASILLAPLSLVLVATLRHGLNAWTGRDGPMLLLMLLAGCLARPALLLYQPMLRARGSAEWLWLEAPKLFLNAFLGSALLVLSAVAMDYRGIARGDMVLDMVLYALLATLLAVYWNRALPGDGGLARAENGYNGAHRERLLLVGQAPELSVYVQALATVSEDAYGVAGIVTPHGEDRASTIGGHRVIGQITELPVILETLSADRLVLVASGLSQAEMRAASEAAARFGLRCVTVDFGLPASRVPATRGSAHPAEGGT